MIIPARLTTHGGRQPTLPRVFCPAARTMVHLTPLPAGGIGAADVDVPAAVPEDEGERTALGFLGPALPDDVARGIAAGGFGGAGATKRGGLSGADPRTLARRHGVCGANARPHAQLFYLQSLSTVRRSDLCLLLRCPPSAAAGELDPSTHQPFDLNAIYAGCPNPPSHIAALLTRRAGAGSDGPAADGSTGGGFAGGGGGGGLVGAAAAGTLSGSGARPRFGMSKKRAGNWTAATYPGVTRLCVPKAVFQ